MDAIPRTIIPVRWHRHEDRLLSLMGPLRSEHPLYDAPCPACDEPLGNGETITVLVLGPGADQEAQKKCRSNRWFNAEGIALHAACSGGTW